MCEQCEAIKQELWAEVHDLVNFNAEDRGPLSKALARKVSTFLDEPEFQLYAALTGMDVRESAAKSAVEAIRCMMISQRLAFITMYGHSSRGGMAPSIISGEWAGELMQREMLAVENMENYELNHDGAPPMEFVRDILGELIGEPENSEADGV